jgi:hypothetical protein
MVILYTTVVFILYSAGQEASFCENSVQTIAIMKAVVVASFQLAYNHFVSCL